MTKSEPSICDACLALPKQGTDDSPVCSHSQVDLLWTRILLECLCGDIESIITLSV